MVDSAPDYALVPLTPFDRLFERSTFVTGWLVEGTIDADSLADALSRVTEKWRMLAGRVQSASEGQKQKTSWQLRVPLGPLPPNYKTFSLTTEKSDVKLSSLIPLPLPLDTPSLPHALFAHPSTPRAYTAWQSLDHPLTCWHITYCAPEDDGTTYTCLGFSRSHGIFDGIGAAQIVQAVVAELERRPWDVPPLPKPGLNENRIMKVLGPELQARQRRKKDYVDQASYTPVGIGGALWVAGWHLREKYWRGADRRLVVIPPAALNYLVSDVRAQLKRELCHTKVSTGDILTAWVYKTIYSSGSDPSTAAHCMNIGSFRSLLASPNDSLRDYPHNAWCPLPYPLMSVRDLNLLPLPDMARRFAMSREELSFYHVIEACQTLSNYASCLPGHPDADEVLLVSNVSASRILEADWSKLGSKGIVCGYRYSLTPTELLFSNYVYISGRLKDGSVVLDVILSKGRLDLLLNDVRRLIAAASEATDSASSSPNPG